MVFNNMQGGGGGFGRHYVVNQMSTQEIALATGGIAADSETGGVQLNVVPKEGGNTLRLTASGVFTGSGLQSSNLTDELQVRGWTSEVTVKNVYDYGVGLGGALIPDKLWFYTGNRWWDSQQWVGTYFNKEPLSFQYVPDVDRQGFTSTPNRSNDIRFTWQLSPRNKIGAFYGNEDGGRNRYLFVGEDDRTPEASSNSLFDPNALVQGTWTYAATNKLLFEAGSTWHIDRVIYEPQPEVGTVNHPSIQELTNNVKYGNRFPGTGFGYIDPGQVNGRAAASYVTGTHAFKAGLTFMKGWHDADTYAANNDLGLYVFRNGAPVQLTQYLSPNINDIRLTTLGLYGQDQWTIRRLTLNLGVRFDHLNERTLAGHSPAGRFLAAQDFPEVTNVPNWNDVSPRVGAAYDFFGNGKTAVKGSIGRYLSSETTSVAMQNHPRSQFAQSASRQWIDVNGNFAPDCNLNSAGANGECGVLSNSRFGQPVVTQRWDPEVLNNWGVRFNNWQASVSVQHELRPRFALNVAYFRTWYGNFLVTDNLAVGPEDFDPFCITAPVDPRLPGGGGNQICGLYDVKPEKFGQVDNLVRLASDFGDQTEVFDGIDVTFNGRFGEGGVIQGGVSTGQMVKDTCETGGVPSWSQNAPVTPVTFDSPQRQFCRQTEPWAVSTNVKFALTYPLPWAGLRASATYQNLPGLPILASYAATNAQIAPSLGRNLSSGTAGTFIVDLIEPFTEFEDRLNQLDLRLGKIFRVGQGRITGNLDVYNVFNANSVLQMTTRYGPIWLRPTTILGARLFRFSAQVDF